MKGKNFGGIRFTFLVIFLVSLILSIVITLIINDSWRSKQTNYSNQIRNFTHSCKEIYKEIDESINNDEKLQDIVSRDTIKYKVFIVDKQGKVLFSPENGGIKQFDINKILSEQYKSNFDKNNIMYYDIKSLGEDRYIVVSDVLYKGDISASTLFPLAILIFVALFSLLSYGKVKYINSLSKGLVEISKGNLNYRVKVKGRDELSILGKNINYMAEELMNLKEKEKEIEKNKDRLIVSVSHDLRTPLTSIIGYIKLIKEKHKEKDDINKYIDIIDNKSNRLEELINDLFEYTKLTSCNIKLEKMDISLNELMRQVVEGMMAVCNQNALNILFEAPNEELNINVDPAKMVRVFENIISNAIRYSNKNSDINIKILKTENRAMVSIENEGKPIKEDELNKIFDMFYRTDESRNNRTGGSGIGLSIAKSIVELHGGKIWAECEENKICIYVLI
ncbi:sensor histidine kinase [Clostridium beijerinckii]|uniref:histidine kinase n=1 Tax=Clostridium beijerinckii TaxID=1520 RepID=A0A1S9N6J6_CLOBE|nr:HAMP domain-containing sensor histidine kinase [Clostridium beijerinckii]MZK52678.1 HAMP domain-containing protein [Clostridium beijerinckii]MZK60760.1 HAMP domain-containing protein [Clostridium beijerinckii]MZK70991.1 HAMP domain-containing protein [Clostridium beijerinckii]MZK76346.1 HAMP domain-containing protein [Clostridium beijerinckii]MZK86046.1 HAMP domain-containing protein [Clostridium beijerinckii]